MSVLAGLPAGFGGTSGWIVLVDVSAYDPAEGEWTDVHRSGDQRERLADAGVVLRD